MKTNFEIKRLTSHADTGVFREIAQIHQEGITEGFLSTLGIDFLRKLYEFIASSRHAFIFVASSEGQVIGFICGSTNTHSLYKDFIIRRGWQILPILLPKIFSIKTMLRVKETLFYTQKKECQKLPPSEILNFCVKRKYQRRGIAKNLFNYLSQEFKRLRIYKIKIVTGEQQISAQRFYELVNAQRISTITIHNGILSYVYLYNIP